MRQSHLTNVGGLKTAGFLMLVEGSGIGSKISLKNGERREMKLC